jgi:Fic family protein
LTITWQGRPATAWSPPPTVALDLSLGVRTARRTEQAIAAARRADVEPAIGRLLLRSEGIASSNIEGLRSPVEEVAIAELDAAATGATAASMADNLAAVTDALAHPPPLTVAALHAWHRRLMVHGDLPKEMVGAFRTAQGWIGGTSPLDAVYVPPPPDVVPGLMHDLVAFANRDDLDAVTQAAVAHAQFETIHPYGDGNGRVGRIMIGWILARRLHIVTPPPVSVLLARDPGGYLSGLYRFRTGDIDMWVSWFAGVVVRSCDATVALVAAIGRMVDTWRDALADVRADAAAHQVVSLLPQYPVLTATVLVTTLGVTDRAARTALTTLGARGIVVPLPRPARGRGRPTRWWIARDLLALVAEWSG